MGNGDLGSVRTRNLILLLVVASCAFLGLGVAREASPPPAVPVRHAVVPERGVDRTTARIPLASDRGSLADRTDRLGNAGADGIPDFLDGWIVGSGADCSAAFVFDDLSAGKALDRTALAARGDTEPATVPPAHDVVNAYAYVLEDVSGDRLLWAAAERLEPGTASELEFEFHRDRFRLSEHGRVEGRRAIGDLRVRASVGSGLDAVEVQLWTGDESEGSAGWADLARLDGAGCDATGTVCAATNRREIEGGRWPSFDASGRRRERLSAETLVEVGIRLGRWDAGERHALPFASATVTTPADFAIAGFTRVPLPG